MDQMNGNGPPQVPMDQLVAALDPAIGQVIGTMIRGIIASSGGAPPHVILNLIAWKTGNFLATSVIAEVATSISLRQGFKAAFEDGIKKAPMQTPPPSMPSSESALESILRKGH